MLSVRGLWATALFIAGDDACMRRSEVGVSLLTYYVLVCRMWRVCCYHCPALIPSPAERGIRTQQDAGACFCFYSNLD